MHGGVLGNGVTDCVDFLGTGGNSIAVPENGGLCCK